MPFIFEKHQIRVVLDEKGEPLFVACDVAAALGYKDTVNAIKQHCRGVVKHHPIPDALGRIQNVRVIHEPDMYRMIVNSQLPDAERFESWIFEDVIPSVRKTGQYVAPVAVLSQPAAATSMVPVAREYKAAIQIAKLSGLTGNQALLAADRAARNFTGLSPLQIVNVTHLTCEVQEEHLIPSTIGLMLGGVTARDVNKMLEKAGIIEPFRDHKNRLQWRPTEKGKSFVVLKDTGKKHGDGTPVQQMFFLKSVMGELKPNGGGELKQVA